MSLSEMVNLPTAEQFADLLAVNKAIANGIFDIAKLERPYQLPTLNSFAALQGIIRLGLAKNYLQERISDSTGTVTQNGTIFACSGGTRWNQFLLEVIGIDREIVTDAQGNELTTVDAAGNTIPAHSVTLAFRNSIGDYQFDRSAVSNWEASDLRCWLNSNDDKGIPTHQKFTYTGDTAFTVTAAPATIVKVEVNGVIIPQYSGWTYSNGTLNLIATPTEGATVVAFYYQDGSKYANQNPGLLAENGLDEELQAVLAYRKSRTSGRDIIDRVFLLSEAEVGSLGMDTLLDDEEYGNCYPAFYSPNQATNAANTNRIRTDANGTAKSWCLRSAYSDTYAWCVNTSGVLYGGGASDSNGVVPACVIA
ncbi:MAG: DUF6273 domain-containing protein [Clostridia bacterium]|nr:DUF6273 domain-containing protein [Clostridia bacterium]